MNQTVAEPDTQDKGATETRRPPRDPVAHIKALQAREQAKAAARAEGSADRAAAPWNTLSERLREHIGEPVFTRWFAEAAAAVAAAGTPDAVLRLTFPTKFKRDWVENHYGDYIRTFWRETEPNGKIALVTARPAPTPAAAPQAAQVIKFPVFPTETRPIVNDIARSALFAAIQGKDRQLIENVLVAASSDTQIFFTGRQLNQDDHDVFMQLVSVGSARPAGEYVTVSGHSLLTALGRGMGKSQHDQLEAGIKRLVDGSVAIKAKRFTYFGHLIHDAKKDETSGHWVFRLNENLLPFFGVNCYTLIDWEGRKQLKGDLARWLQLQIASHAAPFPVKVETIRQLSGSRNKDLFGFRRKLKAALDILQAAGHIKAWHIDEGDLVHIDRGEAITDSQRRRLAAPAPRGGSHRRR